MKSFIAIFVLMAGISCLLIQSGCTKYKEPAPFFDGLYLKYYEVFGNSDKSKDIIWTREIEYRFKQLESGNLHVSQKVNTKKGKRLNKEIELPIYPQVGENLTLSNTGIVLEGGDDFNFINGELSCLWLPPDKRKKGVEVINSIKH